MELLSSELFRGTDVYPSSLSATRFLLLNQTTIITAIQIIIIIRIPIPRATYNIILLPAVFGSGYLLEVLVPVAKSVVSFVVAACAEGVVDSAGAEEDDNMWDSVVSVGVTLQFRSEYISAL
jgi:hypothetical protein